MTDTWCPRIRADWTSRRVLYRALLRDKMPILIVLIVLLPVEFGNDSLTFSIGAKLESTHMLFLTVQFIVVTIFLACEKAIHEC